MKLAGLFSMPPVLRLNGYSTLAPEELWGRLAQGRPPSALPGDFVLVAEGQTERGFATVLVSSVVSALPYFYYVTPDGGTFAHGPTVFDCWRKAKISWEWNARSLQCLALLQHTVGEDTLHRDIRRVPPAAILVHDSSGLRVEIEPFWDEIFQKPGENSADPEATLTIFNQVFEEVAGRGQVALSLSAGYDSRALLAAALHVGMKPQLATMGPSASTDRRLAALMAREFGLEHRAVELDPQDYLREGARVVEITSGTKTANHWHTHLFIRKAGFPTSAVHLAGSNGEWARTYFLDKGLLAMMANWLPLPTSRWFWQAKYSPRRRIRLANLERILPEQTEWSFADIPRLLDAIQPSAGPLLNRLDQFYACHRVRHFIGNGVALYNAVVPTRSPFLDARFVRAAAGLPRSWKMNSRFHRYSIRRNCARLADFPTDESGISMSRQERKFYWLHKSTAVGYDAFGSMLALPETKALILDSPFLEQFLPRAIREQSLMAKASPLLGLLITLHFAAEKVQHTKAQAA